MSDTYPKSSMFADDLNTAAGKITSAYSNISRFSSVADDSCMIDLDEVLNDQPLSGKNTSGLAYSFSDLKKWVSDSWSYDSDPGHTIVICEKEDGTKEYFPFSDFQDQIKNGTLNFRYNQQFLHDDVWTEKEAYNIIMDELEYDLSLIHISVQSRMPPYPFPQLSHGSGQTLAVRYRYFLPQSEPVYYKGPSAH